jgi:bifunctional non-homologous end joining protein LigD
VQVHLVNEAVKVFTLRGNDWTKRFRKIADDAWHIAAGSAIIDGEVVVPVANGTTDFSVLQNELKGKSTKIVLVAFDLLYLNGYDLRKLPLIERKAHLKRSSTALLSARCFREEAGGVAAVKDVADLWIGYDEALDDMH